MSPIMRFDIDISFNKLWKDVWVDDGSVASWVVFSTMEL